jgi:hypothetical protein
MPDPIGQRSGHLERELPEPRDGKFALMRRAGSSDEVAGLRLSEGTLMRNWTRPAAATVASMLGLAGCIPLEFGYTHESDEYVIVGQTTEEGEPGKADFAGGAEPVELTSGFTDLAFELQLDGVMDQLDDMAMTGFRMQRTASSLEEGDRDDLSFIERVDLYVVGRGGLPSFLMASYDRERDGYAMDVLPLVMHESVGLRLYMAKGLEFYVLLRGSLPDDDVSFRIASDFEVYTTP